MFLDNNQHAFLSIVRAGLWESYVRLLLFDGVDYAQVNRLAFEQSVVGLVAAGLEHVRDVKVPKDLMLSFVGATLQLEHRNEAMNVFVGNLMRQLLDAGVNALLVKGQGIAQCYERPLWRASGDIDLLMSAEDYERAKEVLIPLASEVEPEYTAFMHVGLMIDGFLVELHGTLRTRLSGRVDRLVDRVQEDVLRNGDVRVWRNGDTDVMIPAPDNDVIFLFTHILHHFYVEGIGLRQICDWCRFLWTYRERLDRGLMERRLRSVGLMSEWRAFAAMAVDQLGMPAEAMPLYCSSRRWSRKGERILAFVMECGNFGRNRKGYAAPAKSYVVRKARSLWRKVRDFGRHMRLFPLDSVRFFWHFFWDGVATAARGE
jgi:hypothetical protein